MTNNKYYIATSEANDEMFSEGDILVCDLSNDYDCYKATNLTRGNYFAPFTFNGVKEISEEEATMKTFKLISEHYNPNSTKVLMVGLNQGKYEVRYAYEEPFTMIGKYDDYYEAVRFAEKEVA